MRLASTPEPPSAVHLFPGVREEQTLRLSLMIREMKQITLQGMVRFRPEMWDFLLGLILNPSLANCGLVGLFTTHRADHKQATDNMSSVSVKTSIETHIR